MINCIREKCRKPVYEGTGILVSSDGDFACSQKCADLYKKEMVYFCETILPNDDLFEKWMYGD